MVHPLDRLAGLGLALRTRSGVVFPQGWGDRLTLELFQSVMTRPRPDPVDVVWQPKTEHRGFRRRRGMFRSPVAELLEETMRVVPVEMIEPAGGTDRLVILLPAWNDEGFARRRLLSSLLAERRVASASMDIPFYGQRRLVPDGMPIRTVSDFALMGLGAIEEALALSGALRDDYRLMGVAGYSMGANLAALVSARSDGVATGLMAGSHSPAPVYLDGVLRRGIAWSALGGRSGSAELRRLLSSVSATSIPARPHHRHAVMVGGRHDGFVPTEAIEALAAHWENSTVRWLPSGHAGLWWRHRLALVEAVVESFARLDGQRGSIT